MKRRRPEEPTLIKQLWDVHPHDLAVPRQYPTVQAAVDAAKKAAEAKQKAAADSRAKADEAETPGAISAAEAAEKAAEKAAEVDMAKVRLFDCWPKQSPEHLQAKKVWPLA